MDDKQEPSLTSTSTVNLPPRRQRHSKKKQRQTEKIEDLQVLKQDSVFHERLEDKAMNQEKKKSIEEEEKVEPELADEQAAASESPRRNGGLIFANLILWLFLLMLAGLLFYVTTS
ncbi:LAS superfamily LD-carboxypeptidase LdcB [Pullulanibacillus pueri]|uniref:Uncharacterized protein n=1 Tax=Pullulanibacillus pueri TaxID=1437324 RepID=A0A8J2ZV03_9BACL|nr:hypothetical protein [Pullulanibacillus pueri]MBM7681498.1 LAS superfamily LD-carboxypeptidase LdcB [Pullulanibacillus pueri]GGH79120.1 hypothetical protein GCM10007096_13580 [Pullulanibacillus pueri]